MGFKLGDIIHHARLARPRPDEDAKPPPYAIAPENPVLTDGEEDEADAGEPTGRSLP